jgi:hypothetical protein
MSGPFSRHRRRLVIGVAGVATMMFAVGCASHSSNTGTGALGSGVTPTVSVTPGPVVSASGGATSTPLTHPPTTAHGPTTPAHSAPPASHAYPANYARAVLSAWGSGDNAYLTLLTDAGTAHDIHGYGHINQHWTHIRDDGAAGSLYASYYNNAGDEITIRVINDELSQHHWHAATVQSWDPMTFPSGATSYTKKYVDGWIAGNKARMDLLGTTALTTLFLAWDTPSSGYVTGAPAGTGGDVEVEITDSVIGLDTSVIIHTATLGHAHAIGGCDIGC